MAVGEVPPPRSAVAVALLPAPELQAQDPTSLYGALLETGSCHLWVGPRLGEQMGSEDSTPPSGWHEDLACKESRGGFGPPSPLVTALFQAQPGR